MTSPPFELDHRSSDAGLPPMRPLPTIPELSSGRSRPASYGQESEPTLTANDDKSSNNNNIGPQTLNLQSHQPPATASRAPNILQTKRLQNATRGRIRRIGNKFRERLFPGPWEKTRWGLRILIEPYSDAPQGPLTHGEPVSDIEDRNATLQTTADVQRSRPAEILLGPSADIADVIGSSSRPSTSTSKRVCPTPADPNDGSMELERENAEATQIRFCSSRSENSLKRKSASLRCECSRDCDCRRGGSGASNMVDMDSRSGSNPVDNAESPHIDVPEYPFAHLMTSSSGSSSSQPSQREAQRLSFSHVGSQFARIRRRSNAAESSSATDSWPRPDRLSQAPTIGSNESAISLHGARPVPARSLSMPAVPHYRPGVQNALRAANLLDPVLDSTQGHDGAEPPLADRNIHARGTTEDDHLVNHHNAIDPPSSRTNSTDTASHYDPQLEDQRLADGVPTSDHPSSDDHTPTQDG
ncbi:hypothetical protein MMC28_002736 [Mycoblastus sanguinarius]|nr:hypothetical protein [Mycoblastus sanguinarius]